MRIRINDIKIGKRFREDLGDIKGLAESIKENGQLVPIVLDKDNKLIDGERRIKAFKELGIEKIDFVKPIILSDNKTAETVANKERKQWNVVEAVAIWDAMEKSLGGRGKTLSDSDSVYRQKRAAKLTGYSHDTLSKAKQVINSKNKEWIEEIKKTGRVNFIHKEIKIAEAKERIEKLKDVVGTYEIIVIDPPWRYQDTADHLKNRGTCEYPTMTIEELENIKIPASDDCVLWLWTTNVFMKDAYNLLNSWGFKDKTIVTWDKQNKCMGNYLGNVTEHCILATKGTPLKKGIIHNQNFKWSTLISEKKTSHSTKPELFYKIIDEICTGRKLDYFSRKKREGWDVYGDEVGKK